MHSRTVAIIGDRDTDKFRGWLIRDMVAAGHRVVVCGPRVDKLVASITGLGADYRPVALDQTGLDPLGAVQDVVALARILRAEGADLVLSHSTKQNVVGPLAWRFTGAAKLCLPRSQPLPRLCSRPVRLAAVLQRRMPWRATTV